VPIAATGESIETRSPSTRPRLRCGQDEARRASQAARCDPRRSAENAQHFAAVQVEIHRIHDPGLAATGAAEREALRRNTSAPIFAGIL